ncbi:MAG TPA: heparan-alpha-glucosaminide N-acetyltransferase domain-containing protein [Roseateles sp.]|uniref:acyltransferase family protein n=1 Tax=Roseateles sp. TaxID=1971397 RepID=UPI002ED8ADAC
MTEARRSLALDVFRGATLALMIVVNMSISETLSYGPLLHAPWHGLTLTDLVFPSFLFAVGNALALTLPGYRSLGTEAVLARIARRGVLLFLLGVFVSNFPFGTLAGGGWTWLPTEKLRILGVLQRIALCWAGAALLLHFCRPRTVVVGVAACLLAHGFALQFGGDLSLAGNAARRLDLWLLGATHLYGGEGLPYEPEGLLGTLPSLVNVLAGYAAGEWLRRGGRLGSLLAAGALALAAALLWAGWQPVNKKLWTGSYALLCIGVDLLLLAALSELLDRRGWRFGTAPFVALGRNTLFIYLLAEVVMALLWTLRLGGQPAFEWIFAHVFQSWAGSKPGSLAFALALLACCTALALWMQQRRWFVRV